MDRGFLGENAPYIADDGNTHGPLGYHGLPKLFFSSLPSISNSDFRAL